MASIREARFRFTSTTFSLTTREVVREKAGGYISILRERYAKRDIADDASPESNGHGKVTADVDLR